MQIAVVLSAYDKMSTVVKTASSKAQAQFKKLEKIGKSVDKFANSALIAGGIGTAFFTKTILDAEDSATATARLQQVFKSMGQEYVKSTAAAEEYASKLQMQIGVEDETILAVQAKLATFEHAANAAARANGIFQRGTAAAFDMAAAGFGSAEDNIVQLGKALEDPITGINSLRRSGITFTDAEKKKIKTLVQSKKIFEAQNMVMKAIEKQVGGVAAATVNKTQQMRVAWGEISESIGKMLLPAFNKVAGYVMEKVIPAIQSFTEKHPGLVKGLAIVAVSLLAVGTAAKIMSFMMLTNPIVLIIAAIAAAALLIITNWSKIKAWFANLWQSIKNIFSRFWQWLKKMFLNYTPHGLIIKHWDKIKAFFVNLWQSVKNVFSRVWQWLKKMFLNYTPGGLIIKHWSKIKAFFINLWNNVKRPFVDFWNWITGLGKRLWEAGKNMIKMIWEGIKSMVNKPIEAIKNMVGKIRKFLPFSPAKEGPLRDIHRIKLVETIAGTINPKPVIRAMSNVAGAIANTPGGRPQQGLSAVPIGGGSISINFSPTINGSGDRSAIMSDMKKIGTDLLKQVEEAQRKKDRAKF